MRYAVYAECDISMVGEDVSGGRRVDVYDESVERESWDYSRRYGVRDIDSFTCNGRIPARARTRVCDESLPSRRDVWSAIQIKTKIGYRARKLSVRFRFSE
mmetsp:Transcript_24036/g.43254  ORF Transcript_24036/g.43254 Transcript_24036/m.43254 type:complete len:101 (+) Transcript_24036:538-840(+)